MRKWKASFHVSLFCISDLLIDIKSPSQPPQPSLQRNQLDMSSVNAPPLFQCGDSQSHSCLRADSDFSRSSLLPNIQYHLKQWNKVSYFFLNRSFCWYFILICSGVTAYYKRTLCLFDDKSLSSELHLRDDLSKPVFLSLLLWGYRKQAEGHWFWQCLYLLLVRYSSPRDASQALFAAQNHFERCCRGVCLCVG